MPLVPPNSFRHKDIIIGPPKVGKSSSWLSIAKAARDSGDERKFYVLDTDDALDVILASEQYKGINVELYHGYRWPAYEAFSEMVMKKAKAGDFVVIDMIDKGWSAVQNHVVKELRGKTRTEAMKSGAKQGAANDGFASFKEIPWPVVNSTWDDFLQPLLFELPAHLIMCAEEKDVPDAPKNPNTKDVGKHDRMTLGDKKPAGQKSMAFQARTVLRLNLLARGRTITTLGDREREWLNNKTYENFFDTFYVGVCGWKVE